MSQKCLPLIDKKNRPPFEEGIDGQNSYPFVESIHLKAHVFSYMLRIRKFVAVRMKSQRVLEP